jgi:hypothetical protein
MAPSNRARLFPELANTTWTLWANNEKVKRGWLPIITGMRHSVAVDELITRQDRVRRSGEPCQFKIVEDGMPVDETPRKQPSIRRSK